jgi:hypothetical protein
MGNYEGDIVGKAQGGPAPHIVCPANQNPRQNGTRLTLSRARKQTRGSYTGYSKKSLAISGVLTWQRPSHFIDSFPLHPNDTGESISHKRVRPRM